MKLLSRYFAKKFVSFFLSSFIVIFFFTFLVNFFENMNMASRKGLDMNWILRTLFYQTPYFVSLIIPVITLFGAIMSFNYFISTNEYKAVYSSGYSSSVFLKPLFILSFIVFVFSSTLFDSFAINMYRKVYEIKHDVNVIENYYIYFSDIYLGAKKIIANKLLDVYIENRDKIIITKELVFLNDKWLAYDAKVIEKNNHFMSFYDEYEVNILPPFEEIVIENYVSDSYYDIFVLVQRIKKLFKLSIEAQKELSLFYFKLSLMFLNIIFAILSFLISQTDLIRQKVWAISTATLIAFFMWFFVVMIKRTSDIGIISPSMIFIISHGLFVIILFYAFRRIKFRYG